MTRCLLCLLVSGKGLCSFVLLVGTDELIRYSTEVSVPPPEKPSLGNPMMETRLFSFAEDFQGFSRWYLILPLSISESHTADDRQNALPLGCVVEANLTLVYLILLLSLRQFCPSQVRSEMGVQHEMDAGLS